MTNKNSCVILCMWYMIEQKSCVILCIWCPQSRRPDWRRESRVRHSSLCCRILIRDQISFKWMLVLYHCLYYVLFLDPKEIWKKRYARWFRKAKVTIAYLSQKKMGIAIWLLTKPDCGICTSELERTTGPESIKTANKNVEIWTKIPGQRKQQQHLNENS